MGKKHQLLFLNQQKHHQREVRIFVFSNSIFSKSWISRFQTKNKSSASSAGGLFTKCQPSINVFSFCFSTPGEINGFLKKDKLKTLYRESMYVCSTYTSLQLTLCRYLCVCSNNENGMHTVHNIIQINMRKAWIIKRDFLFQNVDYPFYYTPALSIERKITSPRHFW